RTSPAVIASSRRASRPAPPAAGITTIGSAADGTNSPWSISQPVARETARLGPITTTTPMAANTPVIGSVSRMSGPLNIDRLGSIQRQLAGRIQVVAPRQDDTRRVHIGDRIVLDDRPRVIGDFDQIAEAHITGSHPFGSVTIRLGGHRP